MSVFSRRMGLAVTIILYLTLSAAIALFIMIPWLLKGILSYYFKVFVPSLVFLYIGGGMVIWLIVEFLLIMGSVKAGTPFIHRNVRSLAHIAVCCGICALDLLVYLLLFKQSIALGICAAILVFGSLCAIVLACVFKQAVLYKEENDLTV